jgi:hypothetical protein
MTEEDKQAVTIILHEYNTLRNEIIQKSNAILQAAALTAAICLGIITALITTKSEWHYSFLALLPLCMYFIFTRYYIDKPIGWMASRLRDIEDFVNGKAGQELLVWEHRYGFGGVVDRRASIARKYRENSN